MKNLHICKRNVQGRKKKSMLPSEKEVFIKLNMHIHATSIPLVLFMQRYRASYKYFHIVVSVPQTSNGWFVVI